MNEPSMDDPTVPAEKTPARKRAICDACREKKRRCDAGQPTCASCISNGEPECVYVSRKSRQSRLLVLQGKIDVLEAEIGSLQASLAAAARSSIGLASGSIPPHQLLNITTFPASNLSSDRSKSSSILRSSLGALQKSQLFRIGFDPLIGSWWTTNEHPPSGLVNILVGLFVEQEHHHTYDPRPPEFYASLYDPNPQTGLHPALRNVIFLLACVYNPGPLTTLEPVFLRNTMYHLNESLARADRLLDYIEAYSLLSVYYSCKQRYMQAIHNVAAIIVFAAACGLHALRPPEWSPAKSPSLLPAPRSQTEIQRRIRIWWIIFTLNRLGNSAMNFEADLNDERIETLWDLPPEPKNIEDTPLSTIASLFQPDSPATYVYNDTANAIRSKCVTLTQRASYLGLTSATVPENDQAFWDESRLVEQAIRRVTDSLPSIFEEPRFKAGDPHVELKGRQTNHYTSLPHMLMCEAALSLHEARSRAGNNASQKLCLEFTRKTMPVIRQLLDQNLCRSVFPYLGVSWRRMFAVLGREHKRHLDTGGREQAEHLIPDLRILFRAIMEQALSPKNARIIIAARKKDFPSLKDELDKWVKEINNKN